MPMGWVHLCVGIPTGVAAMAVAVHYGHPSEPLIGVAAALGSIWPDFDMPGSKITTLTGRRSPITFVSIGASSVVRAIFGHRGAFHSLLLLAAFSYGAFCWQGADIAAGFAVGYFSHLFLDDLTESRVPWWWPLDSLVRRVRRARRPRRRRWSRK